MAPLADPGPLASCPVSWVARDAPLPARACLMRGPAASAAAVRLLSLSDSRLAALTACAADGLLVLLGDEAALPWVDGAVYLGRDPAAPGLLLPTNRVPAVPLDLFARALAARLPGGGPWAVVPRDGAGTTAVCLAAAAPVARPRVEAWLRRS